MGSDPWLVEHLDDAIRRHRETLWAGVGPGECVELMDELAVLEDARRELEERMTEKPAKWLDAARGGVLVAILVAVAATIVFLAAGRAGADDSRVAWCWWVEDGSMDLLACADEHARIPERFRDRAFPVPLPGWEGLRDAPRVTPIPSAPKAPKVGT